MAPFSSPTRVAALHGWQLETEADPAPAGTLSSFLLAPHYQILDRLQPCAPVRSVPKLLPDPCGHCLPAPPVVQAHQHLYPCRLRSP